MHTRHAFVANLAAFEPIGECRRHEDIVEPYVRVPRGESESSFERVNKPIAIHIAGIEHYLNCFPPNVAAAQPYQWPQPKWQIACDQKFARSQRIEVTYHDMKTFLVMLDALKQSAEFSDPPSLCPIGMDGPQVEPEDSNVGPCGYDL